MLFQLCPRMKFLMNGQEPLLIHMSVNLRRADVRMPQHLLNDPQIGAVFQQMAGKGMGAKYAGEYFS